MTFRNCAFVSGNFAGNEVTHAISIGLGPAIRQRANATSLSRSLAMDGNGIVENNAS
jgi:hypothetical protein